MRCQCQTLAHFLHSSGARLAQSLRIAACNARAGRSGARAKHSRIAHDLLSGDTRSRRVSPSSASSLDVSHDRASIRKWNNAACASQQPQHNACCTRGRWQSALVARSESGNQTLLPLRGMRDIISKSRAPADVCLDINPRKSSSLTRPGLRYALFVSEHPLPAANQRTGVQAPHRNPP